MRRGGNIQQFTRCRHAESQFVHRLEALETAGGSLLVIFAGKVVCLEEVKVRITSAGARPAVRLH